MNKLLSILIILIIFSNIASAAEISGNVVSLGKKLADQEVTLSMVNVTQSAETGAVYNFIQLADTQTDKNGSYSFTNLENGMYRANVTLGNITYGENIGLQGNAIVDFNLSGKIEGYVLKANQTLEGVPVRLLDVTGIEVMSTITNKSGKYSFNKVNEGTSYIVLANYTDVPYPKQVNASENADFTVYDSTSNGDIISVTLDHIILSKTSNGIKVDEYVEFKNTGDKVFFSNDQVWLGISTPEGITRFQTDAMECCLRREKDAAYISPMNPILPGDTYDAKISYVFNPELTNNVFNKGMLYNTSSFNLLSDKNDGFGIASKNSNTEIIPNQGKEYVVLGFNNIPKGQIIGTQITGYVSSSSGSGVDFNYLVPVFAIALVGAVSYPFIKKRRDQKKKRLLIRPAVPLAATDLPQEEGILKEGSAQENASVKDITEMSFEELQAFKNATFESIMNLDNEFNAGKITEKEYKELKKEHKEKATLLIKQLREAALNLDLNQPASVLEKTIAYVGDIDVLEELLNREKEGQDRNELQDIIERRIDDIEQNE